MFMLLPLTAQAGNLFYASPGKLERSTDLGQNWLVLSTPLPSDAVPKFFEDADQNLFYLYWIEKDELKITYSRNAGLTFEKTAILKNAPQIIDVRSQKGTLQVLAVKEDKLLYLRSTDRGMNFSPAKVLNETLPLADHPALLTTADKLEIDFISSNKIYRLISADWGQSFSPPVELYASDNKLSDLMPSTTDLYWIEHLSSGRAEIRGLAQKTIFTNPQEISSLEVIITGQGAALLSFASSGNYRYVLRGKEKTILSRTGSGIFSGLLLVDEELYAVWNGRKLEPVGNQKPAAPNVTLPKNDLSTNAAGLKVALSANDPENDPLNHTIQVSWDPAFPADKTFTYLTPSLEAEIPLTFPDGKYFLRAQAEDGITKSPYSQALSFTIDREPPRIEINAPLPGTITNKSDLEFLGTVNENCELKLGDTAVALNGINFSKTAALSSGENRLVFKAKDAAGNATEEAITVIFNNDAPLLTLSRPQTGDWYKKKSTVLIEAVVSDSAGDIEDEQDGSLFIDGILQKPPLVYSLSDSRLSELLTLPDDLSHGVHQIKIELTDSAGNLGRVEGSLNIDDSPPRVLEKSFTFSKDKIVIPVAEEGSGLDVAASLVKVTLASVEVRGSVKKENQNLVFVPTQPMVNGSYTIIVTPRDAIGNLGATSNLTAVFDANHVQTVAVRTSDVRILTLEYGPNPFRPSRDGSAKIKYEFDGLAAAKLYIFSLEGNLILIRNLGSTVSGVTPWDGKNTFGETVSSGLYPIALVATDSSGKREIKRGKLIVF